jgi:hypothetical protein
MTLIYDELKLKPKALIAMTSQPAPVGIRRAAGRFHSRLERDGRFRPVQRRTPTGHQGHEGFAHGFQTLRENCELLYLHTAAYQPDSEAGLDALDPRLAIEWPQQISERSMRDQQHPTINTDFFGVPL